MNPHLERTIFTSKSYTDFAMQKPFKAQSTQPDTAPYQLIKHFTLKVRCMAKTKQAFDENPGYLLSTLHAKLYTWEKSSAFIDKCSVSAVNFKCNL